MLRRHSLPIHFRVKRGAAPSPRRLFHIQTCGRWNLLGNPRRTARVQVGMQGAASELDQERAEVWQEVAANPCSCNPGGRAKLRYGHGERLAERNIQSTT